jgi:hypothetical protein
MAKLPLDASTDIDDVIAKIASQPLPVEPAREAPDADAGLSQEARHARWQSKRPNIDHLADGIARVPNNEPEMGKDVLFPLFDVGERIVIECRTKLLKGDPWLETIVGKVRSIDDGLGLVSVFDEESDVRSPVIRWGSFKDGLHTFKLAPFKGSPFAVPEPTDRPQKDPPTDDQGNPKRTRGRPRGSKNVSKTDKVT